MNTERLAGKVAAIVEERSMNQHKLIILSGTAAEAAHWCRAMGISTSAVRVAGHYGDNIRGCQDPQFVVVGTFWKRPDAEHVWRNLQLCFTGGSIEPTFPVWMVDKQPPVDDGDDEDTKFTRKRKKYKPKLRWSEPDESAGWADPDAFEEPPRTAGRRFKKIQHA